MITAHQSLKLVNLFRKSFGGSNKWIWQFQKIHIFAPQIATTYLN